MNYKRISADCHMDLNWLPEELFVSEASASLKERMPHVVERADGRFWVSPKAVFGLSKGVGVTGRKYEPGKLKRVDAMETTGLFTDGVKGIPRVSDPDMRLKDMELDGVETEVIYGLLGVASRMQDGEAALEVARIYNDWIHEFCSSHPGRQIGLATIPSHDVAAAVREVKRVAAKGMPGIDLAVTWDMEPLCHPMWEPLWQAIADVNLPLHLHTAPHLPWDFRTRFPGVHGDGLNFQVVSVFQMTLGNGVAALIGSAVLERYPTIRVALGECGTGWIPYLLERMDFVYRDAFQQIPLKLLPSEYWRRQCRATFQFDKVGARLIDAMGAETLMWGSDFPHLDGIWPESQRYIDEQFQGVDPQVVKMITRDNAARFYGLEH